MHDLLGDLFGAKNAGVTAVEGAVAVAEVGAAVTHSPCALSGSRGGSARGHGRS
jgi:hypothetical protein